MHHARQTDHSHAWLRLKYICGARISAYRANRERATTSTYCTYRQYQTPPRPILAYAAPPLEPPMARPCQQRLRHVTGNLVIILMHGSDLPTISMRALPETAARSAVRVSPACQETEQRTRTAREWNSARVAGASVRKHTGGFASPW